MGPKIGEWFLPRFNFLRRVWPSTRRRGNLAVASSALGWRQRMGRGSVGGDYISRKGSSAASLPDCDRKFERVTPTSRTPFGGGNTERIRSRATSCSLVPCLDRRFHRSATSGQLKVGPFDLHRDGPTTRIRLLAPGPDIVGHRDHAGLDLNGISQVLRRKSSPIPTTFVRGQVGPSRSSRPRAMS